MRNKLKEKLNFVKELKDFKREFELFNVKNIVLEESEEILNNILHIDKFNPFEKPDMYLLFDDCVIGIEQFEFSAYETTKNGNLIKIKENQIRKDNLELYRKNNQYYFETHIETGVKIIQYENNFEKVLLKHYNNIKIYKENLEKINSNVKIYFLIKDVTVGGNDIIYNGNPLFYNPTMNKKNIELLKKCKNVDGYIFQCSAIYNQNVFFYLKNTEENLNKLYEESNKYIGLELNESNYSKIESYSNFEEEENE
ncbi:MAG: hypothetical protein PHT94_04545 [Candidatus Nanoarchaeia archaeon]|nr:hypothetical protein [Candidatus Nanoarchaeia archaeon]